jgi:hypothetical protein
VDPNNLQRVLRQLVSVAMYDRRLPQSTTLGSHAFRTIGRNCRFFITTAAARTVRGSHPKHPRRGPLASRSFPIILPPESAQRCSGSPHPMFCLLSGIWFFIRIAMLCAHCSHTPASGTTFPSSVEKKSIKFA